MRLVIAIKRVGISGLPSLINACVFLSAYSSGASYIFSASRLLCAMALRNQAPAIFKVSALLCSLRWS